jgi:hypothetical protein
MLREFRVLYVLVLFGLGVVVKNLKRMKLLPSALF